jgi:cobalt-zinc-cadmium efflux system membrane fusion protein
VRQGDIVAAIHSHEVMDARQALAAAQAGRITADSAATVAEAAAGRAERLLAARALSPAEVERAKAARAAAVAARAAAHAELERAEAMMSHLLGDAPAAGVDEHAALIRAPFDGVVTGRDVQPGQVVLVGQPLVTIAREGRLGILMHLPEEAVASVARDVAVRFTVPAYPDRTFRARVMRIAPVVDSLSRAMEVWAAIEGEGQRLLRAEMTANAELEGARGARVLAVPAGAVQVMDGDTVVVVARRVGDGMLLEARGVRLGRRSTDRAEILGGVAVGDSVLDRGAAIGKAELLKRRAARGGAGE